MQFLSREVGPYEWPAFTSAETYMGGGAMEYPMLIMNEPDLPSTWFETLTHQSRTSWGTTGSTGCSERRARVSWLTRGFTQYMETGTGTGIPEGILEKRHLFPWASPVRSSVRTNRDIPQIFTRDEMRIATPARDTRATPVREGAYMKPA